MAKLAKYLPDHGVEPQVLTASNPSVPVMDEALLRDVSPSLKVTRVRTFEPSYGAKRVAWQASARKSTGWGARVTQLASGAAKQVLVPDPQVLWQPAAQRALVAGLAREVDAVLISGPPFSQFLLAPTARAFRNVGVILDYRDEWSTYRSTYEMMGRVGGLFGEVLEARLLRGAHVVTVATTAFRRNLLERFSFLDPSRVHEVPNGYDRDDFPPTRPVPPGDRFVVTYAGTVFKLTSARGFLEGVRLLHEREPELAKLLHVRFLGRVVETEEAFFSGMEELGVRREGYVPHDQVLPALAGSHLALCILDDVPAVEHIYPGKIFELLHLGRRCLTLAPPGVLTELVTRHGFGEVLPPRNAPEIAAYLERALREFRAGTYDPESRAIDVERYDRRALAGEFADAIRQAVRIARR